MQTFAEFCKIKESGMVNLRDASLFDSQSLFNEMALLNPNAINKLQTAMQYVCSATRYATEILKENNIHAVLIGGLAVAHYLSDRHVTPDVDFLVDDIEKIKAILNKDPRIPFRPLASAGGFGGIQVPFLDADFLDAKQGNIGLNNYVLKTAILAKIGGVEFSVINLPVLIIVKFAAGRDKDLDDAFKLLSLINKNELKLHLKAVAKYLTGDIDARTIWSYATMMPA